MRMSSSEGRERTAKYGGRRLGWAGLLLMSACVQ